MSDIFYSVEYIPKNDHFNCWNQYLLTDSKWYARIQLFEAKLAYGRKNRFRIREV